MNCKYEDGKLIFSDDVELKDGEYYIIANTSNDFSLYNKEQFYAFEKTISESLKQEDNEKAKLYARYVYTRIEQIEMKDRSIVLTEILKNYIYLPSLEVVKQQTHTSLIGNTELYDMIHDQERIGEYIARIRSEKEQRNE